MKHLKIHLAVAVCIILLAAVSMFVAYNELKYADGQTVLLETVPVDPRNLFLGDYVILRYAIENEDLPAEGIVEEGQWGWVIITEENPAQAIRIVADDPEELALRGKIFREGDGTARIDIPLDRYYIPVGSGREMPAQPWTVELTVTDGGAATITNILKDGKPITLQARG